MPGMGRRSREICPGGAGFWGAGCTSLSCNLGALQHSTPTRDPYVLISHWGGFNDGERGCCRSPTAPPEVRRERALHQLCPHGRWCRVPLRREGTAKYSRMGIPIFPSVLVADALLKGARGAGGSPTPTAAVGEQPGGASPLVFPVRTAVPGTAALEPLPEQPVPGTTPLEPGPLRTPSLPSHHFSGSVM